MNIFTIEVGNCLHNIMGVCGAKHSHLSGGVSNLPKNMVSFELAGGEKSPTKKRITSGVEEKDRLIKRTFTVMISNIKIKTPI